MDEAEDDQMDEDEGGRRGVGGLGHANEEVGGRTDEENRRHVAVTAAAVLRAVVHDLVLVLHRCCCGCFGNGSSHVALGSIGH